MTSAAPLRSGVIQRWLLLPAAGAFLCRIAWDCAGLHAVVDMPGNRRATARAAERTSTESSSCAVSFGEASRPTICYAVALSAMLAMAGCASPAKQILTSANGYHYYYARYQEACPPRTAPAALCPSWSAGLSIWHKRLTEANDALQRGGKLPLQLGALKRVEKEAKKWTP